MTISVGTEGSSTQEATTTHVGDKYEVPEYEAHSSWTALKDRIKLHYDLASDYYYSLWGEHVHHGYFLSSSDTKEIAQVNLIKLLLEISQLPANSSVLDVGCGIGGTSRYLAREHGCTVTGITISGRQVEMAKKLSLSESEKLQDRAHAHAHSNGHTVNGNYENGSNTTSNGADGIAKTNNTYSPSSIPLSNGKVSFHELDVDFLPSFFASSQQFNAIWISEALSHFPSKQSFFNNASSLLLSGGKLVIADWFKSSTLTPSQFENEIKPIEDGMLLPPLETMEGYIAMAEQAGLKVSVEGKARDISKDVSKTWDISWSLIQSPALWAFAISQGRDGLAFLQAFRAMRRGYANGAFRYGVMCFEKI